MAIALEYREIEVDKLGVVKINKNSYLGRKKACKEVFPLRLQKVLYFTFKWLPFKGYAPSLYTFRDIFCTLAQNISEMAWNYGLHILLKIGDFLM